MPSLLLMLCLSAQAAGAPKKAPAPKKPAAPATAVSSAPVAAPSLPTPPAPRPEPKTPLVPVPMAVEPGPSIPPKEFHEKALARPVPTATVRQTADWVKAGEAVLLDLRARAAYDAGHLAGAKSLPATVLEDQALRAVVPSTGTKVVVYCEDNLAPTRRIALTTLGAPAIVQLGFPQVFTLEPLWSRKECLQEKTAGAWGCPGILPWVGPDGKK